MINLRYHIVSITAVFLALGIGLTLGSTFLDRVTVDTLKAQLDDVEAQVDETRQENELLTERVDQLEQRDDALSEALSPRVLGGHLDEVPMLAITTSDTDEDHVTAATDALAASGAQVAGTWVFTDRWALDDDDEVADLGEVLELRSNDAERLRRNAAIRLAEPLLDATQPPPPAEPAAPDEPDTLVDALTEAGFIEHRVPSGGDGDAVLLPSANVRYLIVAEGDDPAEGPTAFAGALVDELAASAPVPVLAAQGDVALPPVEDLPAPEADRRTTFVGPIRSGELTTERIATIDHLDTAAGIMSVVLAAEDLGGPIIGHYGVAPGATAILPPQTEP